MRKFSSFGNKDSNMEEEKFYLQHFKTHSKCSKYYFLCSILLPLSGSKLLASEFIEKFCEWNLVEIMAAKLHALCYCLPLDKNLWERVLLLFLSPKLILFLVYLQNTSQLLIFITAEILGIVLMRRLLSRKEAKFNKLNFDFFKCIASNLTFDAI